MTLAAISTLAMALVELFKALFSWGDRFHKKRLLGWIWSVSEQASVPRLKDWPSTPDWKPPENIPEFRRRVYAQLLQLTTAEN